MRSIEEITNDLKKTQREVVIEEARRDHAASIVNSAKKALQELYATRRQLTEELDDLIDQSAKQGLIIKTGTTGAFEAVPR